MARFNVNLGTPGCLQDSHWYYGLDNNHGAMGIDLVNVLLHEFAHGLGFQTFTNRSTGFQQAGSPTIYDKFLFDNSTGKTWPAMTDAERVASAVNTGHLVWNGPQVLADVPGVLSGTPRLRINSPSSIAGNYQIGTANFGPALPSAGITANVIQTTPADGCGAITNSISGRIALIDRGNCTFIEKTRNAQNAGAVGVVIVDNVLNSTPPGLGGGPDNLITIPAVSITQANGNTIKGQLGGVVNGTLFADTAAIAGTDSSGRPLMYAPNPLETGSSVSHWDESLFANQLMEPNISGDLFHMVTTPRDLTFSIFKDIGWPGNVTQAVTILTEQGTTNAVAVDSVTKVRGPFTVLTSHNFSADGHQRITIFTTNLGLNPGDDLSVLSVHAQGNLLTVEAAGPMSDLSQTSYIVVRLPTGLPAGNLPLTVTLRGVASTNSPTISIQ